MDPSDQGPFHSPKPSGVLLPHGFLKLSVSFMALHLSSFGGKHLPDFDKPKLVTVFADFLRGFQDRVGMTQCHT